MEVKILLDSNAYSHLKRGDYKVAALVRRASSILLPHVVIGELLYGFRNGTKFERNRDELRAFLENQYVTIPSLSFTTADRYSRIAAGLRAKGLPIPTNDIWIAAYTMESGADLVSYDKHFARIDGLVWTHLISAG